MATIRQRKVPWTRRVLGLFVVVWLNMALQPCAMALGGANMHGCLHCPPVHAAESASHSEHADHHEDRGTSPCETRTAQCAFVDDFDYDGRVLKVKIKDAPSDSPVAIAPMITAIPLAAIASALPDIENLSFPPGDKPALNIIYCVYVI